MQNNITKAFKRKSALRKMADGGGLRPMQELRPMQAPREMQELTPMQAPREMQELTPMQAPREMQELRPMQGLREMQAPREMQGPRPMFMADGGQIRWEDIPRASTTQQRSIEAVDPRQTAMGFTPEATQKANAAVLGLRDPGAMAAFNERQAGLNSGIQASIGPQAGGLGANGEVVLTGRPDMKTNPAAPAATPGLTVMPEGALLAEGHSQRLQQLNSLAQQNMANGDMTTANAAMDRGGLLLESMQQAGMQNGLRPVQNPVVQQAAPAPMVQPLPEVMDQRRASLRTPLVQAGGYQEITGPTRNRAANPAASLAQANSILNTPSVGDKLKERPPGPRRAPRDGVFNKIFGARGRDIGYADGGNVRTNLFGGKTPLPSPEDTARGNRAIGGIAMDFVPGSGLVDAFGYMPDMQGGRRPSMAANLRSGEYTSAGLQGLAAGADLALGAGTVAKLAIKGGKHAGKVLAGGMAANATEAGVGAYRTEMDRGLREGGRVKGPGGPTDDKVGPVMLSDDEYVLPADTADAIGRDNLDAVRMATHDFSKTKDKKGLRGLADGGGKRSWGLPFVGRGLDRAIPPIKTGVDTAMGVAALATGMGRAIPNVPYHAVREGTRLVGDVRAAREQGRENMLPRIMHESAGRLMGAASGAQAGVNAGLRLGRFAGPQAAITAGAAGAVGGGIGGYIMPDMALKAMGRQPVRAQLKAYREENPGMADGGHVGLRNIPHMADGGGRGALLVDSQGRPVGWQGSAPPPGTPYQPQINIQANSQTGGSTAGLRSSGPFTPPSQGGIPGFNAGNLPPQYQPPRPQGPLPSYSGASVTHGASNLPPGYTGNPPPTKPPAQRGANAGIYGGVAAAGLEGMKGYDDYKILSAAGEGGVGTGAKIAAEGATRVGGAWAGAKAGAKLGLLGGPAAKFTVPAGAIAGGLFGYAAPDMIAPFLPKAVSQTSRDRANEVRNENAARLYQDAQQERNENSQADNASAGNYYRPQDVRMDLRSPEPENSLPSNAGAINARFDELARGLRSEHGKRVDTPFGGTTLNRNQQLLDLEKARAQALGQDLSTYANMRGDDVRARAAGKNARAESQVSLLKEQRLAQEAAITRQEKSVDALHSNITELVGEDPEMQTLLFRFATNTDGFMDEFTQASAADRRKLLADLNEHLPTYVARRERGLRRGSAVEEGFIAPSGPVQTGLTMSDVYNTDATAMDYAAEHLRGMMPLMDKREWVQFGGQMIPTKELQKGLRGKDHVSADGVRYIDEFRNQ